MGFFDKSLLSALKDYAPHSFTAPKIQVGFSQHAIQQQLSGLN
jgi:hypothetical protein